MDTERQHHYSYRKIIHNMAGSVQYSCVPDGKDMCHVFEIVCSNHMDGWTWKDRGPPSCTVFWGQLSLILQAISFLRNKTSNISALLGITNFSSSHWSHGKISTNFLGISWCSEFSAVAIEKSLPFTTGLPESSEQLADLVPKETCRLYLQ